LTKLVINDMIKNHQSKAGLCPVFSIYAQGRTDEIVAYATCAPHGE